MKRVMVAVMFLALSTTAYAGAVKDAQSQIDKEKYDSLVSKAKTLLEKKTRLENDLKEVADKLAKLTSPPSAAPTAAPALAKPAPIAIMMVEIGSAFAAVADVINMINVANNIFFIQPAMLL